MCTATGASDGQRHIDILPIFLPAVVCGLVVVRVALHLKSVASPCRPQGRCSKAAFGFMLPGSGTRLVSCVSSVLYLPGLVPKQNQIM